MVHLIPFFLIIIAIAIIVVIVVRKYPSLTLLDVDNMPEVKEERKKEEFIRSKADKVTKQKVIKQEARVQKAVERFKRTQESFRKYVGDVEQRIEKQKEEPKKALRHAGGPVVKKDAQVLKEVRPTLKQDLKVEESLKAGEAALEAERFDEAESRFIAAIRIDMKNVQAYRGLVDVYIRREHWEEAEQTGEYLLRLVEDDDTLLAKMGQISEELDKPKQAIQYYERAVLINPHLPQRFHRMAELLHAQGEAETALTAIEQALAIEPENPRYLDISVELAILVGDKIRAEKLYNRFRMVNPENQKLPLYKEKIGKL